MVLAVGSLEQRRHFCFIWFVVKVLSLPMYQVNMKK